MALAVEVESRGVVRKRPWNLRSNHRVALVLGAGGPVGHGFHAGMLAALHDELGWDPRQADLVVGTSAGAGTGSLLRAGLGPSDLMARMTGDPLSPAGQDIAAHYIRPEHSATDAMRRSWPASPSYLWRAMTRPWTARPGPLVVAMLPGGRRCLRVQAAGLRNLFGETWPQGLWITAIDLQLGSRVAFGKDGEPQTDVGTAVTCSSAVPTVCAAVEVGGRRYIDGGVTSATHLDLIEDAPRIDTVLVSSPLSRLPGMRARLWAEVRRLARCGVRVIPFEPGPKTSAAMGWNPLDRTRQPAVARAAYQELRERLSALGTMQVPLQA